MFEEDYIMKRIREMVRTILKLLFHMDTDQISEEMLDKEGQKQQMLGLKKLIDAGEICEAENQLYDWIDDGECDAKMALLFYAWLNEKGNEYLDGNGFSREEVKTDLKEVMTRFGYGNLMETLMYNV